MKVVLSILLFVVFVSAQELPNPYRNVLVMNGNDITVSVYNYGSYSNAGNHKTDFVWHGLGYAYECGFFFGAEVPVPKGSHADVFQVVNGDSVEYFAHVISDGFTSNGPELNPEQTLRWGLNAIRFNYDSSRVYFGSRPLRSFTPFSGAGFQFGRSAGFVAGRLVQSDSQRL